MGGGAGGSDLNEGASGMGGKARQNALLSSGTASTPPDSAGSESGSPACAAKQPKVAAGEAPRRRKTPDGAQEEEKPGTNNHLRRASVCARARPQQGTHTERAPDKDSRSRRETSALQFRKGRLGKFSSAGSPDFLHGGAVGQISGTPRPQRPAGILR